MDFVSVTQYRAEYDKIFEDKGRNKPVCGEKGGKFGCRQTREKVEYSG
jgi:hypothetical protein